MLFLKKMIQLLAVLALEVVDVVLEHALDLHDKPETISNEFNGKNQV